MFLQECTEIGTCPSESNIEHQRTTYLGFLNSDSRVFLDVGLAILKIKRWKNVFSLVFGRKN